MNAHPKNLSGCPQAIAWIMSHTSDSIGAIRFHKCSPVGSKRSACATRPDVTANSAGNDHNTPANQANNAHPRQKAESIRLVFDSWQFGGDQLRVVVVWIILFISLFTSFYIYLHVSIHRGVLPVLELYLHRVQLPALPC
jgi:hypothetical protein